MPPMLFVQTEITAQARKTLRQPDGHWCNAWDGMAISALTPEYDCCIDFDKTYVGRLLNWFYMRTFYFREFLARRRK